MEEHLEKIEKLINSAEKFNDMSFRMVLEGLVNKGGEAAEYCVVKYITSRDIPFNTRINIIRVVGYVQSPHFLIPLKKVIDTEEHIQLKKEAVISVSKYNDRRALNILNNAIANIKNPLLLETINNEISKIKRNNPVFALLPRFLEGEKNPRNLSVTVGILKRILTPADAAVFTNYLHCGKPLIELSAFEILCHTGDQKQLSVILNFYQKRFDQIHCVKEPECEELYQLTLHFRRYFTRFSELIDAQMDNLGTMLFYVRDPRIQQLLTGILCRSGQAPVIAFVSKLYETAPALRATIIQEYAGNDEAMDLLFAKYHSEEDPALHTHLIGSLLKTHKGLTYFQENYISLPEAQQRDVLHHLPYTANTDLSGFARIVLGNSPLPLKELLLSKFRIHYNFSIRPILFDNSYESDFAAMEKEYLATLTALFPVSSVKRLFEEIVYNDFSANKIKNYLKTVLELVKAQLAFSWSDPLFIAMLYNKILQQRVADLNVLLLEVLKYIKTFNAATLTALTDHLGLFITNRDKKISEAENTELRLVRKNFHDCAFEVRRAEEDMKELEKRLTPPEINFEILSNFFTQNSLSIALGTPRVHELLDKRIMAANAEEIRFWLQFFNEFPMLAFRLKSTILKKAEAEKGSVNMVLLKFYEALPKEPVLKILIRLSNLQITAVLRDQCRELLPDFEVQTESDELNETDMLICDAESIKTFILKNSLPSQKLFLFLENVSEFESFKNYNPRPLMKPFSAYKFIREIMRELYQ